MLACKFIKERKTTSLGTQIIKFDIYDVHVNENTFLFQKEKLNHEEFWMVIYLWKIEQRKNVNV